MPIITRPLPQTAQQSRSETGSSANETPRLQRFQAVHLRRQRQEQPVVAVSDEDQSSSSEELTNVFDEEQLWFPSFLPKAFEIQRFEQIGLANFLINLELLPDDHQILRSWDWLAYATEYQDCAGLLLAVGQWEFQHSFPSARIEAQRQRYQTYLHNAQYWQIQGEYNEQYWEGTQYASLVRFAHRLWEGLISEEYQDTNPDNQDGTGGGQANPSDVRSNDQSIQAQYRLAIHERDQNARRRIAEAVGIDGWLQNPIRIEVSERQARLGLIDDETIQEPLRRQRRPLRELHVSSSARGLSPVAEEQLEERRVERRAAPRSRHAGAVVPPPEPEVLSQRVLRSHFEDE